uniref:ScaI family restriction endonuclease n=1 Tax=uncultured Psychrobacter sp. TaxID=259303 RepID=UPI00261D633B|nr:ScaI family restriction endonuclease [uncultured Psychrobacter sp.]
MISPYANQPKENWKNITQRLVNEYPISTQEILEIATLAWNNIWNTSIGGHISINEVGLTASNIGNFFQQLYIHELVLRHPNQWREQSNKSDKDIVYISNNYFSTEMKTSGQAGYYLYGNRSTSQEVSQRATSGKDKSGYYITLNFHGQAMTRLRIGWIDENDWLGQSSQTGQSATLSSEVYEHKLIDISGSYIRHSPIILLDNVGSVAASKLNQIGIYTFNDLALYQGNEFDKHKATLERFYRTHGLAYPC